MPFRKRITCPRRMRELGPWKREEGLDSFKKGHGLISQERGCSFCGSMDPEEFLERLRTDSILSPSDKNYKAYLMGPEGRTIGKFYYQHLDEDQRVEFVQMLNDGTISFGFPGGFTVLPYFVHAK